MVSPAKSVIGKRGHTHCPSRPGKPSARPCRRRSHPPPGVTTPPARRAAGPTHPRAYAQRVLWSGQPEARPGPRCLGKKKAHLPPPGPRARPAGPAAACEGRAGRCVCACVGGWVWGGGARSDRTVTRLGLRTQVPPEAGFTQARCPAERASRMHSIRILIIKEHAAFLGTNLNPLTRQPGSPAVRIGRQRRPCA